MLVSPYMHSSVLIPFVIVGVTWKAFLPQFQTFVELVPFFSMLDVGSFCSKPDDRRSLRFRLL